MIETERLLIKPLTHDELCQYATCPEEMARVMGYVTPRSLVDSATQEAIEKDLLPAMTDETKDTRFYTMWIFVEKGMRVIIGGLCFHGEPDNFGKVEVGYGIHEDFCGRGYATEAICGVIEWLKEETVAVTLLAETETANAGSIRVLEKNGFIQEPIEDTCLFRLDLRS